MMRWATEILATLGVGCVTYGLYLIYPPLAWIAVGAAAVLLAASNYPRKG
jgi:hypothetical protein